VARGNLVDPAGGRLGGVGEMSKLGWFVFQIVVISAVWYACYQGAAEHNFEGTTEQRAITQSLMLAVGVAYVLTLVGTRAMDALLSRLNSRRATHKGLRQSGLATTGNATSHKLIGE
jgi:hypothetical protein